MTEETQPNTLDVMEIRRMIPHRYPFLMIDRVVDIQDMEFAAGIKNVSANEEFFQGHFPKRPIMPGVLIIEAMGQTASVMVVRSLNLVDKDSLVYFMGIDNAKFRKPVVPGDQLRVELSLLQGRKRVYKFRGEAKVDGAIVAEAEIKAMIMPPEETDTA